MTTEKLSLPETGYLRLAQIVPHLIPISKALWYKNIADGIYPITPVKLSARCTAYRVEDVKALIERLAA